MDTENMRITMGHNIIALREQYAISRKSLAMLIKIPVNRLRRIECGDPGAKLYDFHLRRIARVFDVTIDDLFETGESSKDTFT